VGGGKSGSGKGWEGRGGVKVNQSVDGSVVQPVDQLGSAGCTNTIECSSYENLSIPIALSSV